MLSCVTLVFADFALTLFSHTHDGKWTGATRHSTGSVCVPLAAVQERVSSVPTRIVRLNSLLFRFCLSLTRSPPCPQQINCRLWRHCTYWAGAAASTASVAVPQPSCCCCAVVRLLSYCCILLCCLLLYVLRTRCAPRAVCVHSSTAALGVSRVSLNLSRRNIIIETPSHPAVKT